MSGESEGYEISLYVYCRYVEPEIPSQWGIMIHLPKCKSGDLMQVTRFYNPVGSDSYLPWHLMGKKKVDENSKGMCKIRGGLSPEQRSEVTDKIMEAQTPDPKTHDNKNSNDWVVCALKILEDSEFIPQGTADIWRRMIGKTPEQLQQELGRAWKDLRKESNPTFP